jgi:predicted SprT family Zn-dependent metalloprotease
MIHRKRTHKDITDPKILQIWNECKAEARVLYPQYFEWCEPELYQDSSYRHLGLCSTSLSNPRERNVDKMRHERCIITISEKLGQDYDQIRETLCHELGHFVAPKENHSYLWKVRANKIGARWGLTTSRLSDNETFKKAAQQAREEVRKNATYKYRLVCPSCGLDWKYKSNCKAVQTPGRYRCPKCKTTLKSEKI